MDMPPVHLCVFLSHEHEQLKAKVVGLKEKIGQLERTIEEKRLGHSRTCAIACQTRLPSPPPPPSREDVENEERLRRLVNAQEQLLQKYQRESTQVPVVIEGFERRLARCEREKEQAEQRANLARRRLKKFEDQYEAMKGKMSVFDDGFFEEVNHLKFSLQQAAHLSREYEKTIQMLSGQLGLEYPVD